MTLNGSVLGVLVSTDDIDSAEERLFRSGDVSMLTSSDRKRNRMLRSRKKKNARKNKNKDV